LVLLLSLQCDGGAASAPYPFYILPVRQQISLSSILLPQARHHNPSLSLPLVVHLYHLNLLQCGILLVVLLSLLVMLFGYLLGLLEVVLANG
jgi:hypothetical protein